MGLEDSAKSLPTGPGVYLFRDSARKVLYVGKAQNLRSRVRQYVSGGDGRFRIPALMERAVAVEVLVTPTVKDALLLENELIKQHKPTFNVRLRDDKQYLALRLDAAESWPRLTTVRRFRQDGAEYFGPYTSSVSLKGALSNLRKIFPLRSCTDSVLRDYQRRGRPCIEYEMKRCVAPCCGYATPEEYAELVDGTALFLRGKSEVLLDELQAKMGRAVELEDFEDAALIRDRIQAVARTVEQQQIVTERAVDRDVFAVARQGGEVDVQVLHVREGRVVGAEDFGFSDVRIDDGELMSSFLGQYYGASEGRKAPREVLTGVAIEDPDAMRTFLREGAEIPVELKTPRRGALRELVALAGANAEQALSQRLTARDSTEATLSELQSRCALPQLPRRIECYDVSNLQGTLAVASRVYFENGRPAKAGYRRYRIKEAMAGDDYACLREVLSRRLQRLDAEPLPDLLVVDGGRGQLAVMLAALSDASVDLSGVGVLGIAKERDLESPGPRVKRSGGLKDERVFLPGRANPVTLHASSKALLLLQRVRDESHRFAIEYQRELRQKVTLTSVLRELPGIGPVKQRALLRELGSLRAVRAATEESLRQVAGISHRDAQTIRGFFDAVEPIADPELAQPGDVEQGAPGASEAAAQSDVSEAPRTHTKD